MAKPSGKQAPRPDANEVPHRRRGSPLTDYQDASVPLDRPGFEEAPQPGLTGAPYSGSIAGWADAIAAEAEADGKARSGQEKAGGKAAKSNRKIPERSAAATKTARGTSMGGAATARERAAAGLNPVAGLDVSLEDAETMAASAVTATVAALSSLIESGNPLHKNGELWVPHRPARPEKSEGGVAISMVSDFSPAGDQPQAIRDLVSGVKENDRTQVLLGVTGSGKTFTMAKVIERNAAPRAHPRAEQDAGRAALLASSRSFFRETPSSISFPITTTTSPKPMCRAPTPIIEKESSINEQIDRMRHSATRSLLERDDVIIVASVSCIYGIGSVETYTAMTFQMQVGDRLDQRQLLADLVAQQYRRQDVNFVRGSFRVRGDTIEIFPAHLEDSAWRISMFGDEIESITEFDPLTGHKSGDLKSVKIYANSHYVTPRPTLNQAIKSIKQELQGRLQELEKAGRLLEAQRLEQRTRFDIEMLEATGSCAGIENYSRYLTGRKPGEPPPTLFEYIPDNALVFVDESHVTIPQIGGMYRGDFRRKATLAEYGFRLPSCMDNRPLRFEEWDAMRPLSVAVSATPGGWEMEQAGGVFAEQVIRPTGLIDPPVEVRPAKTQVDDVVGEIRETTRKGYRTLCTVLTKRMAEDLTEYLHEQGVRVRYMHSDIDTLERIEILRDLRLGAFDVLVGINLLREGLDIPECGFVAILDADKEGFLRSETSLIQTIGRAARNVDGKVILYADQVTGSMNRAMAETARRREKQLEYNVANGITPESVKSRISDILDSVYERDHVRADISQFADQGAMMGNNLKAHLEHLQKEMRNAAADLDFERAARMRDEIKRLREIELETMDDPLGHYADMASPVSGREKGKHNKGRALHRAVDDSDASPARGGSDGGKGKAAKGGNGRSLFAKPELDDMGRAGDYAVPAGGTSLFDKPSLDDMGPGTDASTPANAVSRALFRKQSSAEARQPDHGLRDDGAGKPSLFRKNDLDEMTVRRTEKPVDGLKPDKSADDPRPLVRARPGHGSYEDPAEQRRAKRRPGKTGRPGR